MTVTTPDEDDFPHVQKPSDPFADVVYDLMCDAARRVSAELIVRLDTDEDAMRTLIALREAVHKVPLDDVAAWKYARARWNAEWLRLRDERENQE